MSSDSVKKQKTPAVSFEFFPPKTPAMEETLWDTVSKNNLSRTPLVIVYPSNGLVTLVD